MYKYPDTLKIFDSECNETLKSFKDNNLIDKYKNLIGLTLMVKCNSKCNKSQ